MAHKGVREHSNQTLSSYALGQNGFVMLINNNVQTEYLASTYGIEYFTEIKAIEAVATIKLHSYMAGGHNTPRIYHPSVQLDNSVFTDDFVFADTIGIPYSTGGFDYNEIVSTGANLSNGTFISGAFDKITLYDFSYIMAYRGPKL